MIGHTKPIRYVLPTPNGKFVISCSEDKTARMWHLDTGKEVHRFSDESDHVSIALSPDGRYLASADSDGTIHIMGVPKIEVEDDGTVRRTKSPLKR
jgi:WD40 repeat protein